MEGFLLLFKRERDACLRYCVLENGAVHCYDHPHGVLMETMVLTRHRVRVHALVGWKTCPNRFMVYTMPVVRQESTGRYMVKQGCQEQTHCFAAATLEKSEQWARCILNWRRHCFRDPFATPTSEEDAADPTYECEHERERRDLLFLARRFDVHLIPSAVTGRRFSLPKLNLFNDAKPYDTRQHSATTTCLFSPSLLLTKMKDRRTPLRILSQLCVLTSQRTSKQQQSQPNA